MEKSSKRTIVTHHHYPLALRQHDQCKYHETIARRKSKQGEYRGAIEKKLDWIHKNLISKLISILSSLNYPPLCINTAILPLLPLFLKYSSLPSERESLQHLCRFHLKSLGGPRNNIYRNNRLQSGCNIYGFMDFVT